MCPTLPTCLPAPAALPHPRAPCCPCLRRPAAGTFDCARRTWRTTPAPPRLVHYNYGSPRVGNRAFAAEVRLGPRETGRHPDGAVRMPALSLFRQGPSRPARPDHRTLAPTRAAACAPLPPQAVCPAPAAPQFDRLVPNAWRVANANDAVTLVPRMLGEHGGGGWCWPAMPARSACSLHAPLLPCPLLRQPGPGQAQVPTCTLQQAGNRPLSARPLPRVLPHRAQGGAGGGGRAGAVA